MARTTNWAHEGYMDGLLGNDPDPELTGLVEYDDAWLVGAEDREAGVKSSTYAVLESLPELRGREVIVPKGTIVKTVGKEPKPAGRTYTVKVDHTLSPCAAYWDTSVGWDRKELVRPRPAMVVWAGASGYWTEASLESVIIRDQETP